MYLFRARHAKKLVTNAQYSLPGSFDRSTSQLPRAVAPIGRALFSTDSDGGSDDKKTPFSSLLREGMARGMIKKPDSHSDRPRRVITRRKREAPQEEAAEPEQKLGDRPGRERSQRVQMPDNWKRKKIQRPGAQILQGAQQDSESEEDSESEDHLLAEESEDDENVAALSFEEAMAQVSEKDKQDLEETVKEASKLNFDGSQEWIDRMKPIVTESMKEEGIHQDENGRYFWLPPPSHIIDTIASYEKAGMLDEFEEQIEEMNDELVEALERCDREGIPSIRDYDGKLPQLDPRELLELYLTFIIKVLEAHQSQVPEFLEASDGEVTEQEASDGEDLDQAEIRKRLIAELSKLVDPEYLEPPTADQYEDGYHYEEEEYALALQQWKEANRVYSWWAPPPPPHAVGVPVRTDLEEFTEVLARAFDLTEEEFVDMAQEDVALLEMGMEDDLARGLDDSLRSIAERMSGFAASMNTANGTYYDATVESDDEGDIRIADEETYDQELRAFFEGPSREEEVYDYPEEHPGQLEERMHERLLLRQIDAGVWDHLLGPEEKAHFEEIDEFEMERMGRILGSDEAQMATPGTAPTMWDEMRGGTFPPMPSNRELDRERAGLFALIALAEERRKREVEALLAPYPQPSYLSDDELAQLQGPEGAAEEKEDAAATSDDDDIFNEMANDEVARFQTANRVYCWWGTAPLAKQARQQEELRAFLRSDEAGSESEVEEKGGEQEWEMGWEEAAAELYTPRALERVPAYRRAEKAIRAKLAQLSPEEADRQCREAELALSVPSLKTAVVQMACLYSDQEWEEHKKELRAEWAVFKREWKRSREKAGKSVHANAMKELAELDAMLAEHPVEDICQQLEMPAMKDNIDVAMACIKGNRHWNHAEKKKAVEELISVILYDEEPNQVKYIDGRTYDNNVGNYEKKRKLKGYGTFGWDHGWDYTTKFRPAPLPPHFSDPEEAKLEWWKSDDED